MDDHPLLFSLDVAALAPLPVAAATLAAAPHNVYLLVSRHVPPGEELPPFKVGITDALPGRLGSLQVSFGGIDLEASYLIRTVSRQESFWLEALLKKTFANPRWRAPAPVPPSTRPGAANVPCGCGNGHKEWYQAAALSPMLGLVGTIIALGSLGEHFHPPQRGITLPPPPSHGRQSATAARAKLSREERWQRRREDTLRAKREEQAVRETEFQVVQQWVEARRSLITSVGPPQFSANDEPARTLRFKAPPKRPSLNSAPILQGLRPDEFKKFSHYWRSAVQRRDKSIEEITLGFTWGCRHVGYELPSDPVDDLPSRVWAWLQAL